MSNPYGTPPAPSGPPSPPPMGNQPPAPQPYGQPGYYGQGQPPADPYGQNYSQQGYQVPSDATVLSPGSAPHAYASIPTPQQRTSKMGLTAFLLALFALVLGIVCAVISGSAFGALMEMTNGQYESTMATPAQNEAAGRAFLVWASSIIPTIIGIVAIVLGFVARKFANYRVHSLLAIIIGFLAPVICGIVFMVSIASVYKP